MQFNGGGRRSAAVLLLCTLTSGLSATVCATAEEPAVSNSAERWVRWLHRQWAAYRISAWAEPGSQAPMLVLDVIRRPGSAACRATCGPHPRRFAAASAVSQPDRALPAAGSRPELVCQPVCTPAARVPSLSRGRPCSAWW